jgi:uncharacterized pyridoxamine 5'-phosphate oxidase family protein
MWAVNDNSRPRVLFIESNVIIHENNNVFIFQSTFPQELIGMTNISLGIIRDRKKKKNGLITQTIKSQVQTRNKVSHSNLNSTPALRNIHDMKTNEKWIVLLYTNNRHSLN